MNFRFFGLFIVFLILILTTACEEEEGIDQPEGIITFGIRHDKSLSEYEAIAASNNPNRPDFNTVVAFSYSLDGSQNEEFIASGTLINEEWILTAGHNFYDAEEQNSPAPASGITVKVGNDPNNPDQTYEVAEIVYHPTWLANQQDYEDANDLCLVKLSTPVTNLIPTPLHTTKSEILGTDIWFCGFGDYSSEEGQDPDLDSRKHAVQNILDRMTEGMQTTQGNTTYDGGLLAFDFDDPDGSINSLGDSIISQDEFILGQGTSTGIALEYEGTTVQGDSGGPLFVFTNGRWELAGVLSGGASEPIANHSDGSYGDISIFTRVSTAYSWIKSVIE